MRTSLDHGLHLVAWGQLNPSGLVIGRDSDIWTMGSEQAMQILREAWAQMPYAEGFEILNFETGFFERPEKLMADPLSLEKGGEGAVDALRQAGANPFFTIEEKEILAQILERYELETQVREERLQAEARAREERFQKAREEAEKARVERDLARAAARSSVRKPKRKKGRNTRRRSYLDGLDRDQARALRQQLREEERSIPPSMRRSIIRRDCRTCRYCGTLLDDTRKVHIDHVVPHELGGLTEPGNLVTACGVCNLKKRGRTPEAAGMTLLPVPE